MSKELKKYKARIFGEIYSIVSDEDDSFVLEVVHKVDALMKEIAAKPEMALDTKKVAVLAALKATEDVIMYQRAAQQEQERINKILMLLDTQDFSL